MLENATQNCSKYTLAKTQARLMILPATILTAACFISGCVKSKDFRAKNTNNNGAKVTINVEIGADSSPVEKKRPQRLAGDKLEQMIKSHQTWLSENGLAFALGTNESFQSLQEPEAQADFLSDKAKEEQISFSIIREGAAYQFTLLRGGSMSLLCDRVAEEIRKSNIVTEGARASAVVRYIGTDKVSYLHNANLDCADFRHSSFFEQDMQGVNLIGADLRNTYFIGTDLSGANLRGADLRGAKFWKCNLTSTVLVGSDLRGAVFSAETIMNSVTADAAKLDNAHLEPKDISNMSIVGTTGLSEIVFLQPYAAVRLRTQAKEAGLKGQERALTSAIHKWQVQDESSIDRFFEAYIVGGKLTNYGADPWRSITVMLLLIPVFALAYVASLEFSSTKLIVIVTDTKGRERNTPWRRSHAAGHPVRRGDWFLRWISTQTRIVRAGFYLSLMTAFRFGWHELNVGSWISGLQFHDYTLRPTGWLRTIGGIQSVTSLYLLALWAITLFSNPF